MCSEVMMGIIETISTDLISSQTHGLKSISNLTAMEFGRRAAIELAQPFIKIWCFFSAGMMEPDNLMIFTASTLVNSYLDYNL